ncbi:hypothetical protein KS4_26970 [Poriferisphaera corsica]|uniref:Uncharacterized protein n=1 Tax=Poriferisphaera corsica TaxID=2528020 RepID=A0A517YWM0_9BACT|nr:hypothetical protein [Poriferisphaera corsica]QDU34626.1 hypothetical protein KS4_26970 [Poriferisphaera corsica]
MSKLRNLKGSLRQRGGWKQKFLWGVLLCMVVLGSALFYLTRPERLGRICTLFLEQATGARATIREASITQDLRIELSDVDIRVPGREDAVGRLMSVEEVEIDPSIWSILTGSFQAEAVRLVQPTVYVTEDLDSGLMNFQILADNQDQGEGQQRELPTSIPVLSIRDAKVVLGVYEGGEYVVNEEMEIEGRINRKRGYEDGYYFVLREMAGPETKAPKFEGEFNLEKQTFLVNLSGFEFQHRQLMYLPMDVRNWWERLGLRGDVPTMKIGYEPIKGVFADVELTDGEVKIPFEEFPAKLSQVDLRMQIENDRVHISRLTGELQAGEMTHVRYSITGDMYGLEASAPFELRLNTDKFEVADDPEFIFGMPPEVQKQYSLFTPRGLFRASARISRKEAGGDIAYRGTVDLLDVRGEYKKFKFPLEKASGEVLFERNLITLQNVRGKGLDGGDVLINGTIKNPGPAAESQMKVHVDQMPINQRIFDAMKEKHRKMVGQFVFMPAADKLAKDGLIRLSADETGDAPVFKPGGKVDMDIDIYRPGVKGAKPQIRTDIAMRGSRVLFKHWPYPVIALGGHVIVDDTGTLLKDLKFAGLSGGEIEVDGRITKKPENKADVDVRITKFNVPSDAYLVSSVPESKNEWLKRMRVGGMLHGEGLVKFELPAKPAFTFKLGFKGMELNPLDSGYLIKDMSGQADLTQQGIVFRDIKGTHEGGEVEVNGEVDWSEKPAKMAFDIEARDLVIERAVLSVLPPEADEAKEGLGELFDTFEFGGRADLNVAVSNKNELKKLAVDVSLKPYELSFDYNKHRFELTDMSGVIRAEEKRAIFDKLGGKFKNGEFEVSGIREYGEYENEVIDFKIKSAAIDLTTRALLPENIVEMIDDYSINGSYEVEDGRLIVRDENTDRPKYEIESTIKMTGGMAKLGMPITGYEGDVKVKVIGYRGQTYPWVDLQLDAERFFVMDRLVQPFEMQMTSGEATNQLIMRKLRGDIYGGTIVGDGEILLGDEGDYRFDVKVHDANVDAVLTPKEFNSQIIAHDEGADNGIYLPMPEFKEGTLSASLLIEQNFGDVSSRCGRGMLQVRDAKLYNQPLGLALLQAASFTLPTAQSFDSANARYVVDGDTVYVDSLAITSAGFEMRGSGEIGLPEMNLDLTMYTKNPNAIDIGPLGSIIDMVKNEFIAVQVGGTMSDPQAMIAPFTGFRNSWNEIFGSKQARRQWDDIDKTGQ